MMGIKNINIIYDGCKTEGIIRFKEELDIELIKSLIDSAKRAEIRIKKDKNIYEKETEDWTFIFRDNYEILRTLIDAFLLFDKVTISNHQCSNAHLCIKHQELDFDWNILETMRILRNSINYKGETIDIKKWNKFKLQFKLYIKKLIEEIDEKMKES